MKKLLTVASLLAMFFLLFTAQNSSAAEFRFDNVKFYESGYDATPKDQRVYTTQFPKSTTRYITYEVNLTNLMHGVREHSHNIVAKYYNPDGSLRGELTSSFTVKSSWATSWHTHGWGWKEPGNWPVGTYTVKIWLDGAYIWQGNFKVYDDKPQLRFTELKFFESGYDMPPYDQRSYTTYFSQSTTRYVNVEVSFINDLYMVRDQMPIMTAKYYSPDGSLFSTVVIDNMIIKREWDSPWLARGTGWKTPGNWKRGTYRVEVFLGSQRITEGRFTIN